MARLQRFVHSVTSGYAVLVANVLYTLASVPLALHFLDTPRFGLWAVVSTISGYLTLVDLGMSAAFTRLLIDHKSQPNEGTYGGMIQAACLVLFAQGILIFVVGAGISLTLGPLLQIPGDLGPVFTKLMLGQAAILAFSFATKIFSQVLYAHHRLDVQNYGYVFQFGVSFVVLWVSLQLGAGVYSLLWSGAAFTVLGLAICALGCVRLRLFPARGCWGRPTWSWFREIFSYGASIFFINLGNQLVYASQAAIVTRFVSLEAAAVWTVCTRLFQLVCQVAWRPLEASYSLLSEMIVSGERDRLRRSFDGLVVLTLGLTVVGGAILALCNESFVTIWAKGRIGWSPLNDVLLAGWLVVLTAVRCNSYLLQASKELGFLRYLFFVEGSVFVGLAFLGIREAGFTGVIVSSIICTVLISCIYTTRRASAYLQVPVGEACWRWFGPALKMMAVLIPLALGTGWCTAGLSTHLRLAINATVLCLAGIVLLARFACQEEIKIKCRQKLPRYLLPMFTALAG